jgi:hypothetical protein
MINIHTSTFNGFFIKVGLQQESIIPKFVPVLKKGVSGVGCPLILFKAVASTPLNNSIKNILQKNSALSISSCKCHSPMWTCAMDVLMRRSSSHRIKQV